MRQYIFILILNIFCSIAFAESAVSPSLFFQRNIITKQDIQANAKISAVIAPVTVRFNTIPTSETIDKLERNGLYFKRNQGHLLHTRHIYLANVDLHSLETLASFDEIERIEHTQKPAVYPTLEISNPQVQASSVWSAPHENGPLDGTGVLVANFDTGIDIYHPGFFKADGGTYNWIDFNRSGYFDSGIDYVDLNGNNERENNEMLSFFDASFSDPLNLVDRKTGIFDADIDWLYNDANLNGIRDYGPKAGYSENDPSFGELLFIVEDINNNKRLDPGEKLTALGTSKVSATYDINGEHYRGSNLFSGTGDTVNHGTGSSGIVGGQLPGRRFTGMAPGVEFLEIDRSGIEIEEAILWAKSMHADIFMYEFASFVYEFLDGTSNLEVMINDLYNEGFHQFTASGNLAGPARKKHARMTLNRSETNTISFTVPEIGITKIFSSVLWKSKYLSPRISLQSSNGSSVIINGDSKEYQLDELTVVSGIDISSKDTNRMDIYIFSMNSFSGDFTLNISNRRANDITIDAYVSDDKTHWMNGTQFTSHVTDDGTVCSPGTAEKGITVGAYDPRGTRNEKGAINDFSSWGNTIDGRRAVDITAPGTLVYSLTSHDAVGGNPGGYIDFGGTSAALPHVSGCAALILQAHPEYTPDKLSQVLFEGALADDFTGEVPNNIWGYGKLRVFDALYQNGDIVAVKEDTKPSQFTVSPAFPNPFNSSVAFNIDFSANMDQPILFSVYNILGQRVFHRTISYTGATSEKIQWEGSNNNNQTLSSGMYFFSFSSDDTMIRHTALFLK